MIAPSSREMRRSALKDSAVLMTCAIFVIASVVPTILLITHGYTVLLSISPDAVLPGRHVLGLTLVILVFAVVGGYIGIVAWLLSAKYFFRFSREDVLKCAHAGPRIPWFSTFDERLIDSIYRKQQNGA